jgi:hypothetical protein
MKNTFLICMVFLLVIACKKEKAGTDNKNINPVSATFHFDDFYGIYFTDDSCLLIVGVNNLKSAIIKTNYSFKILWSKNTDDWGKITTYDHAFYLTSIHELNNGKYVCFFSGNYDSTLILEINKLGERVEKIILPNAPVHIALRTDDGGYILSSLYYVTKIDENYKVLWQKKFSSYVTEKIRLTSDGGYAMLRYNTSAGEIRPTIEFIKFDSNWNMLLDRYPSLNKVVSYYDFLELPDKGFLLAGTARNNSSIDGNYIVIRIDAAGDTIWTKTFGNSSDEIIDEIVPVNQNEFVLRGTYYDTDRNGYSIYFKINTEGQFLDSIQNNMLDGNIFFSPLHYYFIVRQMNISGYKVTRVEENMLFKKE